MFSRLLAHDVDPLRYLGSICGPSSIAMAKATDAESSAKAPTEGTESKVLAGAHR